MEAQYPTTSDRADVIVVVLEHGQNGAKWANRARRVLFVTPPCGRPDQFVTYPHNYFEVPVDEHGLSVFSHRVLSWFKPGAVYSAGPTAEAQAEWIRAALADNSHSLEIIPDPKPMDDQRPRVALIQRHVANVLYDGQQPLIPRGIVPIYVSHATGGLNIYKPGIFYRTFICDFLNQEETRVVCEWVIEQYAPDRIVALHEKSVMFAAALRDKFNLPGLDTVTAARFRDKAAMKEYVLERTSLKVPRYVIVDDMTAFDAFERTTHHPGKVVLKPLDGLGAERTFICRDVGEARDRWEKIGAPAASYEMEEFIDGDIYHVDAVVVEGAIRMVSVSEYLNSPAAYERGGDFASVALAGGPVVDMLTAANADVLAALGPVSAVTHVEFFVTPDSEVVFCEAAARPGGAGIAHVLSETHGINAVAAALLVESGLDVAPARVRPDITCGWVGFYPDGERTGHIDEDSFAELGIISAGHSDVAGLGTGEPRHSCDFVDKFIVRADDPQQFRKRINTIRGVYRSLISVPGVKPVAVRRC